MLETFIVLYGKDMQKEQGKGDTLIVQNGKMGERRERNHTSFFLKKKTNFVLGP